MKIVTKPAEFQPVTITLESPDEVAIFLAALGPTSAKEVADRATIYLKVGAVTSSSAAQILGSAYSTLKSALERARG